MQEHMKKKKVEILKFMEEKGISLEDYKVITSELWYYDDLSFFYCLMHTLINWILLA